MPDCRFLTLLFTFLLLSLVAESQRVYRPSSVLASGNWYRIATPRAGIYKMDLAFLGSLGIPTANLASSSIRLYGNGGGMLPEANAGPRHDDLVENAIQVVDGGDGILGAGDYVLFYSGGPDSWIADPAGQGFRHQKNLYSGVNYFYLQVGGTGLRVVPAAVPGPANSTVTDFSERYFHELDSVNFLASGKDWYGEEFADMPGKTTSRDFLINIAGIGVNTPVTVHTNCVARSAGSASRFDLKLNNQLIGQFLVPPISSGQYDPFARQSTATFTVPVSQPGLVLHYSFLPGSFNAQGWLNWFELFARRELSMTGSDQLPFRDRLSVGPGNVAEFVIRNAPAGTQVWDITEPLEPGLVQGTFSGNEFRFRQSAESLREYIAFTGNNIPLPVAVGKVANQDLHQSTPRDYLVITYPEFLAQAQSLAAFHQQREGLRTLVVTTEQVYHEFGGGMPDPGAIRDFVKMYFDKYGTDPANKPRFLLLFGDASYDYRERLQGNTNFVPAWQNNLSLDPLSTYTSDDFFGFLDDQDDINSGLQTNYLDIAIGRVPARNADEAKNFVDKLLAYHQPEALGPWRTNLSFIADDEDLNLHLQDAETFAATSRNAAPEFNLQKIYLDAFRQESGSGGSHYPDANLAINNQVYNGTLIWNYNGHGGARRLAEETILDQEMVNRWNNPDRLPLFITATCDFAPYDNPAIQSLGENILLRPRTGCIALMTTTRLVFAFSNRIMNDNYLRLALERDAAGQFRTLGEAVMAAKNYTYQTSGDITNNRKFTLLGDPAMRIGFPRFKVRTTLVNGIPVAQADTLRATEKVVMEGEVTDLQGNLLQDFNGTIYPVVYDKPQTVNTLANDPGSLVASFQVQSNALFKGKASVINGRYTFSFRMPRDINYQFGAGRLGLYAENGTSDAMDAFTGFIVGGLGNGSGSDQEGPFIKCYLNDEQFVNGGITNESPVLLVKLADSSGINTAGTGIGHDLIVTLDNDNNQYFILNDFYQSDLDDYQKGALRFQLPALEPGPHTLRVKAWDVVNNSSEAELAFTVVNDEELVLSHVLNYPNPFTTKTQFWFEHNKPGQNLVVRLQIFTITGRVIKMLEQTINTPGTRSSELEWDGRDEYGDKVGRGTYLYKLSVTTTEGQKRERIEKMVVF